MLVSIPKLAIGVEKSQNAKTGAVAATYAAQQSCPSSCTLRGAGCYAEKGNVGIHTRRINGNAEGKTALDVARAEAAAIDSLKTTRDLRLHVVGDCPTAETAEIVSAACERYVERSPTSRVWSYTHAWKTVPREAWGSVSILASVHTFKDALKARERGYSPAIVVDKFPDGKHPWKDEHGTRWIPCHHTVFGTKCVDCGLCMIGDKLFEKGYGIAFERF